MSNIKVKELSTHIVVTLLFSTLIILLTNNGMSLITEGTINVDVKVLGPPNWINLRNFTQMINLPFSQTISASGAFPIDGYFLNETSSFNISRSTGFIINITSLSSVKTYWLNISVNDTGGYSNSGIFYINITTEPSSPTSQCNGNFTVLKSSSSNTRPYGRICWWLDFR